jgi:D-3-phosphoglycerate dehydrogenase / 2-oxoglutarate reductase
LQIGILESNDFSNTAFNLLKKIGDISMYDENENSIAEFIEDKEVLFIRLKYYLNSTNLKSAHKLKYICSPTTGHNHLDINCLNENNIQLVSLKGEVDFLSNIRATPEHTFGLTLSLLRNYKFVYSENKDFSQRDDYKGNELYKKKIGIIGYGRVGKIISKYFLAFESDIGFFDTDENIKNHKDVVRYENIETLITNSDIIILTASYSVENENMINKDLIALMKHKYFINTARGELIDEKYLIEKIQLDYFNGVALDVLKNETSENNLLLLKELSKNKNIITTPHIAGATYESMYATEEFIVKKLIKTGDYNV